MGKIVYTHESRVWIFSAVKVIFGEYETHWLNQSPVGMTLEIINNKFEDIYNLYCARFPNLPKPNSPDAIEMQVKSAVYNQKKGYKTQNYLNNAVLNREAAVEAGFMKLSTVLRFCSFVS